MKTGLFTFKEMKTIETLDFIKTQHLMVNGVSLFDITEVTVENLEHDLVIVRFISDNNEVASISISDYESLLVSSDAINVIKTEMF